MYVGAPVTVPVTAGVVIPPDTEAVVTGAVKVGGVTPMLVPKLAPKYRDEYGNQSDDY